MKITDNRHTKLTDLQQYSLSCIYQTNQQGTVGNRTPSQYKLGVPLPMPFAFWGNMKGKAKPTLQQHSSSLYTKC